MTTPNTTLTPTQRVEQLAKLYSGDNQYNGLLQELQNFATELETAQKELAKLQDPTAVWVNILRGTIKAPEWLKDCRGLEQQLAAKTQECEELEIKLRTIGDMAVVDWDDKVVGMVDSTVPFIGDATHQKIKTYADKVRNLYAQGEQNIQLRNQNAELLKAEHKISEAYLRIRKLVNSFDTDFAGENRFEVTEQKVAELLKDKERFSLALDSACEEVSRKGSDYTPKTLREQYLNVVDDTFAAMQPKEGEVKTWCKHIWFSKLLQKYLVKDQHGIAWPATLMEFCPICGTPCPTSTKTKRKLK